MKLGEDKEEELDKKGLIGVDKKMGDYVFVRKESSMRKDGGDVCWDGRRTKKRAKKYTNLWCRRRRVNLQKWDREGRNGGAQEAFEQMATQAMEEGRVLDKSWEAMAGIGEKMVKFNDASMSKELGKI